MGNPAFPIKEYENRLYKVRQAMEAAEIDLLFIEDPSNIAWLTGYDGWSFYTHQGVLVFHDAPPIWWGREMDAQGARHTVWMPEDRVVSYSDEYVQSSIHHPMQDLAKRISDLGYSHKRVGVELENYYFSAKAYLTLHHALPQVNWIDATSLVNWQRLVKSSLELKFIARAAKISERIIKDIISNAEVGMAKNHLVAEIYRSAIEGVDDSWGDYPAIVPMLPSGAEASAPHLTWNGDTLKKGELTFFEISGCYRRYHAPLCRTLCLGKVSPNIQKTVEALQQGLEAGLEVARPGKTAGDIAKALKAELKKANIERKGRVGYSVGLSYPPDWGERTVSLREEDETILQANMTFHFMPGLWMKNWGLEMTETILIKESGAAEALSNIPRTLFVK